MSRVFLVGSFMADLTVRTPRLPAPGETLIGDSFNIFAGGKGFNQVVAAARAGAECAMVGSLGEDSFADLFWEIMDAEGIDATRVETSAAVGTGVALPMIDRTGQNAIIIVPQANFELTPAQVEEALEGITSEDLLLMQLEISMETTVAAAVKARAAGARVVLNPAPYQKLPPELLECIDVFAPNEIELADLAGDPEADVETALATARKMLPQADIVVTLGELGVMVLSRDAQEAVHIPAHQVEAIDTVGAGDVFCGNLTAALSAGKSLVDAAARANLAASIAVTRPGSALAAPTRAEVEAAL